ncbi:MAG: hypothetical protein ACTSRP_02160 [Candidatus Helarchaeota archaeon]
MIQILRDGRQGDLEIVEISVAPKLFITFGYDPLAGENGQIKLLECKIADIDLLEYIGNLIELGIMEAYI